MYQADVTEIVPGNRRIPKLSYPLWKHTPLRRSTIQMLASETKLRMSTLNDALKHGYIVRRTNALKRLVTNQNKFGRMRFSLLIIRKRPHEQCDSCRWKMVYIKRKNREMNLGPVEVMPERSTKSKHIIPNVMFLFALAFSQYDRIRKICFDGIFWPFLHMVPAQRPSRNLSAGFTRWNHWQWSENYIVRSLLKINTLLFVRSFQWHISQLPPSRKTMRDDM